MKSKSKESWFGEPGSHSGRGITDYGPSYRNTSAPLRTQLQPCDQHQGTQEESSLPCFGLQTSVLSVDPEVSFNG